MLQVSAQHLHSGPKGLIKAQTIWEFRDQFDCCEVFIYCTGRAEWSPFGFGCSCFKTHVTFVCVLCVTVRKRGKESVSVTDSVWLWDVRLCSVAVTLFQHCSSHNCRTQLTHPPSVLLPLSRLMPLIVQTWGLSRIACRLFTATADPPPPSHPHLQPYTTSLPIVSAPPLWDPHHTPSAEGGFKRPEHTACPVISHFKGSFQ